MPPIDKSKDGEDEAQDWKHVPDSWLTAAITSTMTPEDFYLTWKHLAECEVCRDRYHERIKIVRKGLPSAMPAPADISQLLGSSMIGSVMGKLGSMMDMIESSIDWDEIAVKLVASAEKISEFDALTFENLGFGISDPEHAKECDDCKSKIQKACSAVKKLEKSLPHKKPTIDRVVEFLESFGKPQAKKSRVEESEHRDQGPTAFGA